MYSFLSKVIFHSFLIFLEKSTRPFNFLSDLVLVSYKPVSYKPVSYKSVSYKPAPYFKKCVIILVTTVTTVLL